MESDPPLKMEVQAEISATVLRLSGSLVVQTAGEFDEAVDRLLDAKSLARLTLDMSDLAYIDSSGVNAVVRVYRRLCEEGRTFRLTEVHSGPLRVFQLMNLISLFDLSPGEKSDSAWNQRNRGPMWDEHEYTECLLAGLGECVVALDMEGRVVFANSQAEKILGWSFADLAGRTFAPTLCLTPEGDPGACDGLFAYLIHSARKDRIYRAEYSFVRKDGAKGDILLAAALVRRAGREAGLLVGLTDISLRKTIERRLHDNQDRYVRVVEAMREGLAILDEHGRISYANEGLCEMLSRKAADLKGKSPLGLLDEASGKTFMEAMGEHCVDVRKSHEWVWTGDNGGHIATSVVMEPTMPGAGAAGRLLIVTDLTERKKAQARLEEKEDRYRRLIEAVTNYTYSIDVRDGQVVTSRYNEGCVALTGYTPEEFEANPLLQFTIIDDEDKDFVIQHTEHILVGKRVEPLVYRIQRRNGDTRWVRSTAVPTFDDEGGWAHYDILVEDVTEQHRMEQQLRQAQKMEALGRLAGGIAHDFNNLLTAILGNLSLMEMECPKHLLPRLRNAQKGGQRATNLVRQLLAFSRKSPAELTTVDVSAITSEVVDMARKTFDKCVEVFWDAGETPCLAWGDAGQIHQILLNLLLNARDSVLEALAHDKPVPPRIIINVHSTEIDPIYCRRYPEAAPGRFAEITVSDTGVGMDTETKNHIFDPFFTTKESSGTGLGLATVFGIVKQHSGWITVDTAPDQGARFQVYLPEATTDGAESEAPAESEPLPGHGETVLLVDDEEMVRTLGRTTLERLGYNVIIAKDGVEALKTFLDHREEIHVTVLDVSMPLMSGTEALRQIRQAEPMAKAILTSGYSNEEILHKSPDHIVNTPFIPKPFRPSDLARMVRKVLDE